MGLGSGSRNRSVDTVLVLLSSGRTTTGVRKWAVTPIVLMEYWIGGCWQERSAKWVGEGTKGGTWTIKYSRKYQSAHPY